jgi:hypothetical protein
MPRANRINGYVQEFNGSTFKGGRLEMQFLGYSLRKNDASGKSLASSPRRLPPPPEPRGVGNRRDVGVRSVI